MRGGKGAKGGARKRASKAPVLTSAEALELEFHMQEQKIEKMRRKLKEDYEEELRLSKVNALKVASNWRTILRKAKTEELKREIDVLAQNHDRQVDRKDAILSMLLKDLEVAEEQYRLALRSHLQNVDELIRLQQARIQALSDEFAHDVVVLRKEFMDEREEMDQRYRQERNEIQTILGNVTLDAEEKEEFIDQEFSAEKDDITSKHTEVYHYLKVQLESKIEEKKDQLIAEHERNTSSTYDLMTRFEMLKTDDARTSDEISRKMRKLMRLSEEVASWKAKLASNIRECEERNQTLRKEKEALDGHFKKLKGRMSTRRNRQKQRLTDLVANSNRALEALQQQKEQAERILKLSEINRRLETEREKIQPFYRETKEEDLLDEESREELHRQQQEFLEETFQSQEGTLESSWKKGEEAPTGEAETAYSVLRNFNKRYNKVLLDTKALEQEQHTLREENSKLRALLKQYFDGISVNQDALSQPNHLLMVQEMTVGPSNGGGFTVHRPVVEANVVVHNYASQRRK